MQIFSGEREKGDKVIDDYLGKIVGEENKKALKIQGF